MDLNNDYRTKLCIHRLNWRKHTSLTHPQLSKSDNSNPFNYSRKPKGQNESTKRWPKKTHPIIFGHNWNNTMDQIQTAINANEYFLKHHQSAEQIEEHHRISNKKANDYIAIVIKTQRSVL